MVLLAQQAHQVLAIAIFLEGLGQLLDLCSVDEACTPSDLFGASDLQALALFQRGDELARFQQALMRAGIQPRVAALHDLHIEIALIQIGLVHGRDFQFASGAGLDGLGDVHDLPVVEVQAGDGIVALGLGGLFFDAHRTAALVESDHAIALGVVHVIGEDGGAIGLLACGHQLLLQVMAVEDVVAQHQCAGCAVQELLADDEGLCQPIRAGLHGVLEIQAPLAPVAQQLLKARRVLRRADDEDVAHSAQHQRAERVVDHGLVIDRQQLLADRECGGVQARAGAAGKDDALALLVRGMHVFFSLAGSAATQARCGLQDFSEHAGDAVLPGGQAQAEGSLQLGRVEPGVVGPLGRCGE